MPALRTPAQRPNRTMTLGSEGFAACIDSLRVAAGSVTATAAKSPAGTSRSASRSWADEKASGVPGMARRIWLQTKGALRKSRGCPH